MNPMPWRYLDTVTRLGIAAIFQAWLEQPLRIGVFALVCEQEPDAVSMLQQLAAEVGVPLSGAVVPGLIVDACVQRKGVLLLALDAATPKRIVRLPHEGNRTLDSAVRELAGFVETHANEDGRDTLLLFVDAMMPDEASVLDRLYLDIGDLVSYVGTSVGSKTFKPVPCLFDNETFAQDAVLALLLPQHPGAVLAHHYCGNAFLRVATATDGNRISAIDGLPAFDVYRELMESIYDFRLTQENFYQYAVHYPFAIHLAEGEPLVRIPVAVEDDGAIFCVGEVPENAMLGIVEAIPAGNMSAAREVASGAQPLIENTALMFYCAGRFMHLGEAAAQAELAVLAQGLAPKALFGALSLGEIGSGRLHGYPLFHNTTIVVLPWH